MDQKIAIFSDVHGNLTALEAVYQDALHHGVTDFWFLGDLFSPGPGADDLWQLFLEMNPSICIRGNWEDLLINSANGVLSTNKASKIYFAKLNQTLIKRLPDSVITTIASWPLHFKRKIGVFTIGCSHNLPNLNHGQDLYPTKPQENFDGLFVEDKEIDIALYAHVHHPIMRYGSNEQIIINPGSVGQPFSQRSVYQADLRARYAILNFDDTGLPDIDFRKVAYDHELEYMRARSVNLPYLDLYQEQLKTGHVHSHDQALLAQINKKRGYEEDVLGYNQRMKKGL
ncbi:metallophosphoesterase family protein [Ligilactobacillus sp. WILCCON 0076]|uniref:Metallophosphoesterase family protein n=1 Tax=Ligilactobacillus ubinensis TaxID=2876789 RepID=A0A9X2FKG7_9LACO|nr:metallophosphoesterase family protein [Ligilactobacillus ubinensis]MCP0887329.1 metallophosphoesterase family protein [Ligilactobacillus ubinensis]